MRKNESGITEWCKHTKANRNGNMVNKGVRRNVKTALRGGRARRGLTAHISVVE